MVLTENTPTRSKKASDAASVAESYVETTSLAAAKALSKIYSDEGKRVQRLSGPGEAQKSASGDEEDYVITQRKDENGKTFYRIRPRSRPVSPADSFKSKSRRRHSVSQPSPTVPSFSFNAASPNRREISPAKSVRYARSNPQLRSKVQTIVPDQSGFYRPEDSGAKTVDFLTLPNIVGGHHIVSPPMTDASGRSRAVSIPSLSQASSSNLEARGVTAVKGPSGDVLGRLLGWSPETILPMPKSSVTTLRSGERPSTGSNSSFFYAASDYLSEDELPQDLVKQLDDISDDSSAGRSPSTPTMTLSNFMDSKSETPQESPSKVPLKQHTPVNRSPQGTSGYSSPFGEGVRLPSDGNIHRGLKRSRARLEGALPRSDTSTTCTSTTPPADSKKARFEDPNVFEYFQALEHKAEHHGFSSPHVSDSPRESTSPTLGHHARLDSTVSLASFLSRSSVLSAHQITVSAAPSDDPRFVIWGTRQVPTTVNSARDSAITGSTGMRSPRLGNDSPVQSSPVASKRWSSKERKDSMSTSSDRSRHLTGVTNSSASSYRDSAPALISQKVMMAATVERWVAELTSKIEADLLTDFFLTYRTFLTPLALCKLLIARFDWATSEASSPEDEAGRRIVRVRTFVVIRHWLLNYFVEDFVPSAELRSRLTSWLNGVAKQPSMKDHPKDQQLIKGLKKVVRRLKETYAMEAMGPIYSHQPDPALSSAPPKVVRQAASQASLRSAAGLPSALLGPAIVLDEDVDLNLNTFGTPSSPGSTNHARVVSGSKSTTGLLMPVSPPRKRSMTDDGTLTTSAMSSPPRSSLSSPIHPPLVLPRDHTLLSRTVSSTLGQFGRFKRMINNRSSIHPQQFDDPDEERDFFQTGSFQQNGHAGLSSPSFEASSSTSPTSSSGLETSYETDRTSFSSSGCDNVHPARVDPVNISLQPAAEIEGNHELHHSHSSQTIRSERSTSIPMQERRFAPGLAFSNGFRRSVQALSFRSTTSGVQLDDIGLSDDSDDEEMYRSIRRLPKARNLRQANELRHLGPKPSYDSISSIGTSLHSFIKRTPSTLTAHLENTHAGPPPGQIATIPNFVADGLDSDDEESGDVEAALRRLEGQIDHDKQREKAKKVERQMIKSKDPAKYQRPQSDTESEDDEAESEAEVLDLPTQVGTSSTEPLAPESANETRSSFAVDRPSTPMLSPVPSKSPSSPERQSRLSTIRQSIARKPSIRHMLSRSSRVPATSVLRSVTVKPPPVYHSFLLSYKNEAVARQLCLIERDLLANIGWHELVQGSWRDRAAIVDTLDWEHFRKNRARELVAARDSGQQLDSTEIKVVIARFNLVANWCSSEIVQTRTLDERVALVNKFIRLAWKCYRQSNFQTLTQIIHGLQSPHVERLKKTWSKVGLWEVRVFKDLKEFTSHARNFRSLRNVTNALAEEWGPPGQGMSAEQIQQQTQQLARASVLIGSRSKFNTPQIHGCIPFLGLFLRDLAISGELPTFLDPSSPASPVEISPETAEMQTLADPSAFADLPSLPEALPIYPLVNVHKHRTIAGVVSKVLVFQEMSALYNFETDAPLFRKCLGLRCLPESGLRESSLACEA